MTSSPLLDLVREGGGGYGPWETMTQTSTIKSVAISLLKHLLGGPLGTTTTLVDHWFMSEASLPPIKTAFVLLTDMFGGVVIKANVTNFK